MAAALPPNQREGWPLREKQQSEGGADVRPVFEPYFALHDSFPVGPRQAQKVVKRIANRARITVEVTPHVLRHTFATLFLQKGGSLAALKKILGHDRLGPLKGSEP